MTLVVHITIELQQLPQLYQLLQELRPAADTGCGRALRKPSMPSMGETEGLLHPHPTKPDEIFDPMLFEEGELDTLMAEQKESNDPDPDVYLLEESPPGAYFGKRDFIDLSHINSALQYFERDDQLCIRYISTNVWTTWSSIQKVYARFGDPSTHSRWGPLLKHKDKGNRRQAVSYFLRAMAAGLKPGQSTSESDSQEDDPDDDFRPHLKSVIDTSTRYDGGKVEGTMEG